MRHPRSPGWLCALSALSYVAGCSCSSDPNPAGGDAGCTTASCGDARAADMDARGGDADAGRFDCDGGGPGSVDGSAGVVDCEDLVEGDVATRASVVADDGAASSVATLTDDGVSGGGTALRAVTESGSLVHVRFAFATAVDASADDELRLAIRALNTNTPTWQINVPLVVLEDSAGHRRTYDPTGVHVADDGVTWSVVSVPLAGSDTWRASGDAIDRASIAALEIGFDTWGYGFTVDLDAVRFVRAGTVCRATCPRECSGRGRCDVATAGCVCSAGATGPACETCVSGFVEEAGRCVLPGDAASDEWPNAVSRANSDPWLAVHHGELRVLRPKLLVLNFVDTSDADAVATLVGRVIASFREGSRARGYADPAAEPQLEYELLPIVDLRDGVAGRPPAPADWPYENSTLFPRRADLSGVDYRAFYSADFARYYGFEDPDAPGSYLDLCAAVDRGLVHELWMVASQDVPDAVPAEVLEHKQRYTAGGNRIEGSFDPCAGNGCFSDDTPHCSRSFRIGFVNYTRGPGCYLHSQGHGLEHTASGNSVPALREWFMPFAAFDLDARYGLPFSNLYGLACPEGSTCASYPWPDTAVFTIDGAMREVRPYDAVCGNVHFPPNAQRGYDYDNATPVLSSCASFGRYAGCGMPSPAETVSNATWSAYRDLAPDCGGEFLVWWYQNMPAFGSGRYFPDGRPMPSVWPFLFY